MSIIQEHIIMLRKSANTTQKSLAKEIGVSEIAIQRYEYGTRKPTIDVLISLADYFDVSLDYLTGRTDNPDSHKL